MRVQFSLRSFILFALLLGSGGLLWRNAGPWAPSLSINVPNPGDGHELNACYFNGADWIMVLYRNPNKSVNVRMYNAGTGQLAYNKTTFDNRQQQPGVFSSTDGRYVVHGDGLETLIQDRHTGKSRQLHSPEEVFWSVQFGRDIQTVFLRTDKATRLLKLPELTELAASGRDAAKLSRDGATCVAFDSGKVRFFDALTGQFKREWNAPADIRYFSLSPDAGKIAFHHQGPVNAVLLYSESGALLYVFSDRQGEFDFDGKHMLFETEAWQIEPAIVQRATFPRSGDTRWLSDPMHQSTAANTVETIDLVTGKVLWSLDKSLFQPGNRDFAVRRSRDAGGILEGGAILDVRTGRELFALSPARWNGILPEELLSFAMSSDFLTVRKTPAGAPVEIVVWRLTRPVEWWGVACLFEFWLAAALGAALSWSLVRELRSCCVRGANI